MIGFRIVQCAEKPGNAALLCLAAVFLRISGKYLETLINLCECLPLQRSGHYRTWPMPGLCLPPAWKKCQGAHPGGDGAQPAMQSQSSTGWALNSSFPWLFPCCNPCSALMCSLSRARPSVTLFVFKFFLPFVFLWPSSSTTVWLNQNSALAQIAYAGFC